MPKTNYRDCWWLVQVVAGDFGDGSYKNGTGYSMWELNNLRPMGERITRSVYFDYENAESTRIRDSFRKAIMRWRTVIYNEFGLAIKQKSDSGTIKGKGEGGYYYYLHNPDLLDEQGKTLKEHIKFLADSEKQRDSWIKVGEIDTMVSGNTSSMGYLSAGGQSTYGYLSKEGTSWRTILGEENLEIIQFAMQFGEILTIKYGKIRTGVDINAPYSFEPYQLKEIEGRWYVIGNLYPLGHKELAELAIYDLARLMFADEDNPDVLFEPVKGFDINNEMILDAAEKRKLGEVRAIDITAHTEEFLAYLHVHPLCSAQDKIDKGKYRIYITLSRDQIVQFGAYGAELSFNVLPKEGDTGGESFILGHVLNRFRRTGE